MCSTDQLDRTIHTDGTTVRTEPYCKAYLLQARTGERPWRLRNKGGTLQHVLPALYTSATLLQYLCTFPTSPCSLPVNRRKYLSPALVYTVSTVQAGHVAMFPLVPQAQGLPPVLACSRSLQLNIGSTRGSNIDRCVHCTSCTHLYCKHYNCKHELAVDLAVEKEIRCTVVYMPCTTLSSPTLSDMPDIHACGRTLYLRPSQLVPSFGYSVLYCNLQS